MENDNNDKWWEAYKYDENEFEYVIPSYKVERFKNAIAELKTENEKLNKSLDHWHKTHSHIIKGLTEEKKQITASMRNEIDSLQKQLNQQDFQLGDLNYLINSLRVEIDKLDQQNKIMKDALEFIATLDDKERTGEEIKDLPKTIAGATAREALKKEAMNEKI